MQLLYLEMLVVVELVVGWLLVFMSGGSSAVLPEREILDETLCPPHQEGERFFTKKS